MATITSLGVGAGMDLEGLVQSLMQIERRPLTALENQSKSYSAKISALGALSSKLSALQTAAKNLTPATLQTPIDKFATYKGTVGDTSIASASVSTGAVTGSYSLEVTQLAQGQRLTSNPFAGGASSAIATGTLTIDFGTMSDGTFNIDNDRQATIQITSDNNTLSGLRNAINQANLGLSATIVNGTNGAQLVITGKDGSDQTFKLSGLSGFEFDPESTAPSANFSAFRPALNAEFSLNGISASSTSNTVTNVLDGVTLTLSKQSAPGVSTTLEITRDNSSKLKEGVEAFIKAYNEAAGTMQTQGAYNVETKTAGALQGNSVLRDAQITLSSLLFSTTAGGSSPFQRFSDLGISLDASGNLKLNSEKLDAAIAADATGVANLVAKVGKEYDQSIERVIGLSGSIKISTDSMNRMIRDLDKRQEAIGNRLVTIEARYRKQFGSLDTLMSSLNKTSSYLAQQLSNL